MRFNQRLNMIMNLTETTNRVLAQQVSLDPSYISRLRRGERNPAKNENYIKMAAGYFAQRCQAPHQQAALADAMKLDVQEIPADSKQMAELIHQWLLETPPNRKKDVEEFMDGISQFHFKKNLSQPEPYFSQHLLSSIPEAAAFRGIDGKRRAVLSFLQLLQQSPQPQTMLLYSDEDLAWLIDCQVFRGQWTSMLAQAIRQGHKIKIIHSLSRNLEEMFSAIEEWLPLYMTGAIEPYYYPKTRDGIFRRTLFIAPQTAAVFSSSVCSNTDSTANFLVTGTEIIEALAQEFHDYLELCRPLMLILTREGLKQFSLNLNEFEQEEGRTILLTDTMSSFSMPAEVVQSVISRWPGAFKKELLAYQQQRAANFEQHLQRYEFIEIVKYPDMDEIDRDRLSVTIIKLLGAGESYYTRQEYCDHLENIIRLLQKYPHYQVYLADREEIPRALIYVKEDVGVIVAKTTSPAVTFAINESNMTAAIWDYMRIMTQKLSRSKRQKKDTINQLSKIIDGLRP